VNTPVSGRVVADPDRRFHAWLIDRLAALVGYGAAAVAAYLALIEPGHTALGVTLVVALVVLGWFLGALLTGLAGVTPGKVLCGLRVVGVATGSPIGLRAALARQALLAVGGYPTLGLGDAALAWMATSDGSGLRRAGHDVLAGSVVVDVRSRTAEPAVEPAAADEEQGRIVNLTALRLMPAAAQATPRTPLRPARAAAPPLLSRRWRVTFDTGQSLVVEGLALVGRRPAPRPGERPTHLVPLHSDDMSLSKTHAQFGVVPDGTLVVMDRCSTNGSVLLRGGVARPLPARRPVTLLPGDRVRFGDREMVVAPEA
jgi:uncharacterized RDD family membrane protein YckC